MKNILKNIKNFFFADKYVLLIVCTFLFSRFIIYVFFKFEFTYYLKDYLVQYLDPILLKNNLFESIFYLHSQPPLFNFLIGLSEIAIPAFSDVFWWCVFLWTGLATAIIIFRLMTELKLNRIISFFLTVLYMVSPSALLYESLFFYTHIIIFFISCAAFFLLKFFISQKKIYLSAHFSFIALCSLTTGFFHLVWFLIIVILVSLFLAEKKSLVIRPALIPFVVLLALYTKNLFVFDNFSASTWFGMNLSRITVHQLPMEKRKELVSTGKLSDYSLLPPFPSFDELENYGKIEQSFTGISVLDQLKKSSGRTNFNNLIYIKVSQKSFKDALFILVHYPEYYFSGVTKSFKIFFDPPSEYKLLTHNAVRIDKYVRAYNAFVYGYTPRSTIALFPLIIIPILIIYGFIKIICRETPYLVKLIVSFILVNILFVMFTGNLFEFGENNRFRYYTEAFYYILAGIMFTNIFEKYFQKIKVKNGN